MCTEDVHLIDRCLNGEPAAFSFLVDKYKTCVYTFSYSKLGNFHDAEDITQEAFIKAYHNLRTLKRQDNFLAWLYAITSNLCKNFWRSRSNRPDREYIANQEKEVLEELSISVYREELWHDLLHEALASLPEMHRQVLTLHYLGGMNSQEIARFLGLSPATVRQRLSRARSKLKEEMLTTMSTTNDGTLVNGPTWVAGNFGKALAFNGSGDFMQAGSKGFPVGAEDRTIAFWVKSPNTAVSNKFLVGWGNGTNQQMSALIMGWFNTPVRKFAFWGWNNDFEARTELKDNTWYHIAFTLKGERLARLYVNGKVDREGVINTGLNTPEGTAFFVANFTSVMTAFEGNFAEIRVFNVALTEDDINRLMQGASITGVTPVFPSRKLTITWGQIKNYE